MVRMASHPCVTPSPYFCDFFLCLLSLCGRPNPIRYFIFVVLGVELYTVCKVGGEFLPEKVGKLLSRLGIGLIVLGGVMWVIYDEQLRSIFLNIEKPMAAASKIATIFADTLFSFFFSKLVTCTVVAHLCARMFGWNQDQSVVRYATGDDDTGVESHLSALDIFYSKPEPPSLTAPEAAAIGETKPDEAIIPFEGKDGAGA